MSTITLFIRPKRNGRIHISDAQFKQIMDGLCRHTGLSPPNVTRDKGNPSARVEVARGLHTQFTRHRDLYAVQDTLTYTLLYLPVDELVHCTDLEYALHSQGYRLVDQELIPRSHAPVEEKMTNKGRGLLVRFADSTSYEKAKTTPIEVDVHGEIILLSVSLTKRQENPVQKANTETNKDAKILSGSGLRIFHPEGAGHFLLALESRGSVLGWDSFHSLYRGERGDKNIESTATRIFNTELLGALNDCLTPVDCQDVDVFNHATHQQDAHRIYRYTVSDGWTRENIVAEFQREREKPENGEHQIIKVEWFSAPYLLYVACCAHLGKPTPIAPSCCALPALPHILSAAESTIGAELVQEWKVLLRKMGTTSSRAVAIQRPDRRKNDPRRWWATDDTQNQSYITQISELANTTLACLERAITIRNVWATELTVGTNSTQNEHCKRILMAEYKPTAQTSMAALQIAVKHWCGTEGQCRGFNYAAEWPIWEREANDIITKNAKSLPPALSANKDDAVTIHFYTREEPRLYAVINHELREGTLSAEYADLVYYWDHIMREKMPKWRSHMLFRGVNFDVTKGNTQREVRLPCFTSTTYVKHSAENFAKPHMWAIRPTPTNNAVSLACVSQFPNEAEVVLPPRTTLFVGKWWDPTEKDKYGIGQHVHVVSLQEEPPQFVATHTT
eukprot:TRINITY_DN66045_c6_g2_i1.p1 TRINITY_DN66045_c6_g2~~TRINITY_DN66045_c6_g2_i1.p1  ORF type:complete len:677 (+),score=28.07 TRINITY_DN66045_c6_g2_i1:69-2099(+)